MAKISCRNSARERAEILCLERESTGLLAQIQANFIWSGGTLDDESLRLSNSFQTSCRKLLLLTQKQ